MVSKEAVHLNLVAAVGLFRSVPRLSDEQIFLTLVNRGADRDVAWRLVEFLPSAYCRAVFEKAGTRFSSTYRVAKRDGTVSGANHLDSDAVWVACLEFATNETQASVEREDLLLLAGRSAEFDAINQLLLSGSKLASVSLTDPVYAEYVSDDANGH